MKTQKSFRFRLPKGLCSATVCCAIFQHERMSDIGEAQSFRVVMAREKCSEQQAREIAKNETFLTP
jgi:hypothetical protein